MYARNRWLITESDDVSWLLARHVGAAHRSIRIGRLWRQFSMIGSLRWDVGYEVAIGGSRRDQVFAMLRSGRAERGAGRCWLTSFRYHWPSAVRCRFWSAIDGADESDAGFGFGWLGCH